jgi:para-aminobenzoate synthetase component 1
MTGSPQPTILTRGVDLELTPDQVFENLHRLPGFFFLDSSLAEHPLARYSYIGVHPVQTLRSRGEGLDLVEGKKIRHLHGNPISILAAHLRQRELRSGSPMIPFPGGAVGYFSYELGAFTAERAMNRRDDLGLPEMHVGFYDTLLAFDHNAGRWYGAAADLTGGRGATVRKRLGKDIDKLAELSRHQARGPAGSSIIDSSEEAAADAALHPDRSFTVDGVPVTSTLSKIEYMEAVSKIREHIAAGDIYQANLTQRWSLPFDEEPGALYRALRQASPAPFGIFLNTGECVIAGSSPESFLSVRGRTIETRPIKGTRPRGATPPEDDALREELLGSEKDRAELTMIADLERNDLGKICEPGSVEVQELYRSETFSNVHHLVSVVRGELKPGVGFEEIMDATFPGGSITGAPKLRAMEILDSLETTVRGPYTGAMGYFGLDGSMELNVAIRTLVLSQGRCHLGVGSGIVADSDPEAEYAECLAKARDMITALRQVGAATGA